MRYVIVRQNFHLRSCCFQMILFIFTFLIYVKDERISILRCLIGYTVSYEYSDL